MLNRLTVDNYRSLVNTTLEPGTLSLLIGGNGSGKTTLFEVLELLRQLLVDGAKVGDLFPSGTLTRWRSGDATQRFQLSMTLAGESFDYQLVVGHKIDEGKIDIVEELLAAGGKPLFEMRKGIAMLFRDDHSGVGTLLADASRSGIAALEPRADNRKLIRFRSAIGKVLLARIAPAAMVGRADREAHHPHPDFSNFAAWYRHLTQEQAERMNGLFTDLAQAVPGFAKLRSVQFPDNVRDLRVELESGPQRHEYRFAELSDGQRALIALYTILHCATEPDALLLLDEPDNFVALAELQPWLVAFADQVRSAGCQALVISHHPECIDYLAGSGVLHAERAGGGGTVVAPWTFDATQGLKPSEAIARGWIDG